MRLFLNGLAASAGGGLTYLRNVIPLLSRRDNVHAVVALSSRVAPEFEGLENISLIAFDSSAGAVQRFWHEQTALPAKIRDARADVVVSTGNFALRNSPAPQILLSGNSLYNSADFYRDLRSRKDYRMLLDTYAKGILARKSVGWADCTVAPTECFAGELRRWTNGNVRTISHGFDRERFFRTDSALPARIQQQLDAAEGCLRLLFVSHYNYYRNFETLFRGLPIIRKRLEGRRVKLFLTCALDSARNPGAYDAAPAAALVRELNIGGDVVELGTVPYELLHHLYRPCDIYATAAYAESFAHPLVEAMASGLPVVASDLGVHREVCGNAAIYFARFSPEELAARIIELAHPGDLKKNLSERGLRRSKAFSWDHHLHQLLDLAHELTEQKIGRAYQNNRS